MLLLVEVWFVGCDKGRGGSEIEVEMEFEWECDSDVLLEFGFIVEDILIKMGMSWLVVYVENIDIW